MQAPQAGCRVAAAADLASTARAEPELAGALDAQTEGDRCRANERA